MTEEKKRYKSLTVGDTKYKTYLTEKYQNRKNWELPDPKKIKTAIPGSIEKVVAKEGKKYKRGEVLLILKAMKMENKLLMPFLGVVKKIHVKEGTNVPKDHLLIELE